MKNNILRACACFVLLVLLMTAACPVAVAEEQESLKTAQNLVNDITEAQMAKSNAATVQEWLNTALADRAGVTAEWYVIALSQREKYDFSVYEHALLTYLTENKVTSASTRLKYALTLLAIGSDAAYITDTANTSVGQQGIMSWVFGLHLHNNGVTGVYTVDSLLQMILSLQLADGGWAVTGENGDVDVTAMTLQALAPYVSERAEVAEATDRALTMLSKRQLPDGDFASYGVSNPESTVQVLTALACLEIDGVNDARFVKNGKTLLHGLEKYRLADGTFSHQTGGAFNENATQQVFYGVSAYMRFLNGQGSLFLLDAAQNSTTSAPDSEENESGAVSAIGSSDVVDKESSTDKHAASSTEPTANGIALKWWVALVIASIGLVAAVVLLLWKKNIRNAIIVLLLFLVAACTSVALDLQTPDDYYAEVGTDKSDIVGTVSITIRCDTIADKKESHIPTDGAILPTVTVAIEANTTVYDVLAEVTAKNKLQLETNGTAEGIYVEGIQYIYEFAYGDLSGWVYRVNGVRPSVGCSAYVLTDGDKIEWLYSCALGEDLDN